MFRLMLNSQIIIYQMKSQDSAKKPRNSFQKNSQWLFSSLCRIHGSRIRERIKRSLLISFDVTRRKKETLQSKRKKGIHRLKMCWLPMTRHDCVCMCVQEDDSEFRVNYMKFKEVIQKKTFTWICK